jgi:hypothetical protein
MRFLKFIYDVVIRISSPLAHFMRDYGDVDLSERRGKVIPEPT